MCVCRDVKLPETGLQLDPKHMVRRGKPVPLINTFLVSEGFWRTVPTSRLAEIDGLWLPGLQATELNANRNRSGHSSSGLLAIIDFQ